MFISIRSIIRMPDLKLHEDFSYNLKSLYESILFFDVNIIETPRFYDDHAIRINIALNDLSSYISSFIFSYAAKLTRL